MSVIRHFRFPVILVAIEACYFLSGYLFWYKHYVLDFRWSSQLSYFPSYYSNGFWIIPLLIAVLIPIIEKYGNASFYTKELVIKSVLFIASFAGAFALWQIPEINPDAVLWNYQARYIVDYSVWSFIVAFGRSFYASTGLPLPTLIFGLAYMLFGVHRFAIQLVNSTLFGLIVVLAYMIGKELFTKEVGVYSGIILLSSPFMISQVPLTLVDVVTTFFVTLSIYQMLRMMKNPGWSSLVLTAVTVLLASLCKVTSLFFLFPFLLVSCAITVFRSRQRSLVLRRMLVFFAALALLLATVTFPLYMPTEEIATTYLGTSGNPFISILSHPAILNFANSAFIQFGLYRTISAAIVESLIVPITIPVFTLALLGLSFVLLKRDKVRIASCLLLVSWIVVPTLYTLDPSQFDAAARHALPTYPAYAILASSFLCVIKDKRLRRMVLVSILVFSIVSAQLTYGYLWGQSSSRNLMSAAEFLQPRIAKGASVTVCYPHMAAWMSIYAPALFPKGNPFDLEPVSLFSCVDPNGRLPQYLVLVRAVIGNLSSYPVMSPQETQFLSIHYLKIVTFQGGDLQVAWTGISVEIFMLRASGQQG